MAKVLRISDDGRETIKTGDDLTAYFNGLVNRVRNKAYINRLSGLRTITVCTNWFAVTINGKHLMYKLVR